MIIVIFITFYWAHIQLVLKIKFDFYFLRQSALMRSFSLLFSLFLVRISWYVAWLGLILYLVFFTFFCYFKCLFFPLLIALMVLSTVLPPYSLMLLSMAYWALQPAPLISRSTHPLSPSFLCPPPSVIGFRCQLYCENFANQVHKWIYYIRIEKLFWNVKSVICIFIAMISFCTYAITDKDFTRWSIFSLCLRKNKYHLASKVVLPTC